MTAERRRARNIPIDGQKVIAARTKAGLTQVELALKARVSQSYISCIELGDRERVGPPVYGRLCEALGVQEPDTLTPDTP